MYAQHLNNPEVRDRFSDADWKPRLYRPALANEREALQSLRKNNSLFRVQDTLCSQLEELLVGRRPAEKDKLTATDRAALLEEHLRGVDADEYGTWVYYPWSGRLVHVLPEQEFREVRSSRNLYLISPDEQCRLGAARIGIVGLSVGRAVMTAMAREGIGGIFRLADFDHLELSNMNRLDGGVQDLGISKTVLAARQLFEMDPYLKVTIFPEGLRASNLDVFFESEGRLDILIEECDDLAMKILAREKARSLAIPVVMSTSDRGLIDIERFDREPQRPVLHGLLGQVDAKSLSGLTSKEKLPYVIDLLDPDRTTERLLASFVEVRETIVGWPQLASSVLLGGAVGADVARRILLGQMTTSGRFYVDLAELISDKTTWTPTSKRKDKIEDTVPMDVSAQVLANPKHRTSKIDETDIKMLIKYAALAPSGGNCQPWRFVYRKPTLECHRDLKRGGAALDFRGWYSQLALGAAVENIMLAGPVLNVEFDCRLFPKGTESSLVCELDLERSREPSKVDPLFKQITIRMTNRRMGRRRQLQQKDAEGLMMAAKESNAELRLLTREDELAAIGKILGEVDRILMLEPEYHSALMGELRWTPEAAERTRDGIDLRSLELSPIDRVALDIVARPKVMTALSRLGKGGALGTITRKWIDCSSAVGLLLTREPTESRYFHGGRALQRVWLTATSRGIALHPMTALTAIHARAQHEPNSLSAAALKSFNSLLPKYSALFGPMGDLTDVFLFRLHQEAMPELRALRRPLDEILSLPTTQ